MSQSTGAATGPSFRIITKTTGEILVIALPLPASIGGPQRLSLSISSPALPTYDRTFWTRLRSNSSLLSTGIILYGLGLKQPNTGLKRGQTVFEHLTISQLTNAVTEAAIKLPKTEKELVDVAADYTHLQVDVAHLLNDFGDEIWGQNRARTWLLRASDGKTEYPKDLVFESVADREV
jgi:hypothetical protein